MRNLHGTHPCHGVTSMVLPPLVHTMHGSAPLGPRAHLPAAINTTSGLPHDVTLACPQVLCIVACMGTGVCVIINTQASTSFTYSLQSADMLVATLSSTVSACQACRGNANRADTAWHDGSATGRRPPLAKVLHHTAACSTADRAGKSCCRQQHQQQRQPQHQPIQRQRSDVTVLATLGAGLQPRAAGPARVPAHQGPTTV